MKEWRKVPSVSTNGRSHFYNLIVDGRVVASVVWDRGVQAYAVRDETRVSSGGHGALLAYVSEVRRGKFVAESRRQAAG